MSRLSETHSVFQLLSVQLFVTLTPWTIAHRSPWNSPGKNTEVGCHFLLWGIFPTQGPNPGLLHCKRTLPSEPSGKSRLSVASIWACLISAATTLMATKEHYAPLHHPPPRSTAPPLPSPPPPPHPSSQLCTKSFTPKYR